MKIYLVRHGQPNPAEIDPAKGLSDTGKTDINRLADTIKHLNISVAEIMHSGKARAQQTAMILASVIRSERGVNARNGINPDDPVKDVAEEIIAGSEDLMLVGHLPFMGKLSSILLAGDDYRGLLEFTTGAMACIEYNKGKCSLNWFINPEIVIADPAGQFKSYH